ncbi:MAG: hypothetical protein LUC25_02995, partial [Ruminococcus sp.]|nr:hypothetical protein [Ruminococcus sp.]
IIGWAGRENHSLICCPGISIETQQPYFCFPPNLLTLSIFDFLLLSFPAIQPLGILNPQNATKWCFETFLTKGGAGGYLYNCLA